MDVFAKCLSLAPGEVLELFGDDLRTFFHWRMPNGDTPRTDAEVLGFLSRYGLKMDRNEANHCWRICKSSK